MLKPPRAKVFADPEIRQALKNQIHAKHGLDTDTVLIDELGLCQGFVRVDLAVVNGALHGYEIKSDKDSLRRLHRQVEIYGKVLDYATVVAGERHISKVEAYIPSWWEIMKAVPAHDGIRLTTVRRGKRNPERDPRALVELLWREEALALLESRDAARGVRGKPRREAWERICEELSLAEIADAVRYRLKVRSKMQFPLPPVKCGE